jgi:hypothetical protein
MAKPQTFHVLASIKLDNEWNEWVWVGGFALVRDGETSPAAVAQDACRVVNVARDRTVQIEVYNPETKLYDQRYTFKPLAF